MSQGQYIFKHYALKIMLTKLLSARCRHYKDGR